MNWARKPTHLQWVGWIALTLIFNIFSNNVIDRDLNAAINILNEGLRNISAGTVDYTDGADVIPTCRLSAMKSEAHQSLVCG